MAYCISNQFLTIYQTIRVCLKERGRQMDRLKWQFIRFQTIQFRDNMIIWVMMFLTQGTWSNNGSIFSDPEGLIAAKWHTPHKVPGQSFDQRKPRHWSCQQTKSSMLRMVVAKIDDSWCSMALFLHFHSCSTLLLQAVRRHRMTSDFSPTHCVTRFGLLVWPISKTCFSLR